MFEGLHFQVCHSACMDPRGVGLNPRRFGMHGSFIPTRWPTIAMHRPRVRQMVKAPGMLMVLMMMDRAGRAAGRRARRHRRSFAVAWRGPHVCAYSWCTSSGWTDREVELTHHLQMQALEYAPVLVDATELVAELDWSAPQMVNVGAFRS
jgi:hypothetical protein